MSKEMNELNISMRNMPRPYQIRATIPMPLFIKIKEMGLLDNIDTKITEMLYDWVRYEMRKKMKPINNENKTKNI